MWLPPTLLHFIRLFGLLLSERDVSAFVFDHRRRGSLSLLHSRLHRLRALGGVHDGGDVLGAHSVLGSHHLEDGEHARVDDGAGGLGAVLLGVVAELHEPGAKRERADATLRLLQEVSDLEQGRASRYEDLLAGLEELGDGLGILAPHDDREVGVRFLVSVVFVDDDGERAARVVLLRVGVGVRGEGGVCGNVSCNCHFGEIHGIFLFSCVYCQLLMCWVRC